MAPSSAHGSSTGKDLRVLLPFSCGNLRIPDELAAEIGGGEVLVVGPLGGMAKVWPVEVGQDGDGAFLGCGWRALADACGVGSGWLLILRHRGRGVLTVKAFDNSCCFRELGTPPDEAITPSKDASRRPRFISLLSQDSLKKMLMPSKFVRQCILNHAVNNRVAFVFSPLGKVYPIKLEMNRSDVFFTSGWSQFLAFHGITEVNVLLLRYEGNMVFTVKVFGADGCQRESKHKNVKMQQLSTLPGIEERQEALSAFRKCKRNKDWPSSEGHNKPKHYLTPLPKASSKREPAFDIGPPSWIKKQINTNNLKDRLSLATAFCDAIGLRERCIITLKTTADSNGSWQVHGIPHMNKSYRLGQGWREFCRENSLELGDICTFNVVETTMWHVVITRCKDKINQLCYETPSTSSRMKNNRSSSKRENRPKGAKISLNKGSKAKCVFEIGPPAWIKKEINTCAIKEKLYLPPVFCEAIGIWKPSNITLKTSMSSTRSWQARVAPYKRCSHHVSGPGWRSFCQDNGIKVGDICTINIVETNLWYVNKGTW